jgi:glycosyltransferase involved in cell wall biosynthesis
VICVGRIEPHKNQLALIRALRGTNVPLTIVGPPHPHHGDYLERCHAEAGPAVEFVGNTDEADLPALLHRHRTHVAPSLFETTGLVSLEAALAGCGVVSTGRGWAHEYLGADARYCNPWSVRSIRSATLAAEATPASSRLRSRILDRYTWHHAAHATATAYEVICERRRRTR